MRTRLEAIDRQLVDEVLTPRGAESLGGQRHNCLGDDAILRERLFEFAGEAKRRQDLVRHGKFTAAWQFKPAADARVVLMPIPQSQIDANPQLAQNPGY